MRYCISDPHGEYGLLCRLLDKIKFSPSDELIVCGDILDKGSEPVRLAKLLFSLPNVKCIMGNHEYEFLKFYWALMQNSPEDFDGVLERLRAYLQGDGATLDWDTVDALEGLPFYLEERDFVCVHAGAPLDAEGRLLPLNKAMPEQLVYDRNFKEPSVLPKDSKCVLFGHTPTGYIGGRYEIIPYSRVEDPRSVAECYKIHLDTGVYLSGVLGCVNLDTLERTYTQKTIGEKV